MRTTPLHHARVIEFVVENRINCSRINVGSPPFASVVSPSFFSILPLDCYSSVCLFVCLFVCFVSSTFSKHFSFFENGTLELVRDLQRSLVSLRVDRVQIGDISRIRFLPVYFPIVIYLYFVSVRSGYVVRFYGLLLGEKR